MILECVSLSKKYSGRLAVDDFSLQIEAGEVLGLIGPNGAGKSTLIKMMTGLIWPTSGYVTIDGYDVQNQHAKALSRVGAIIEWPSFLSDLSARMNLKLLSGGYGREFERRLEETARFVDMFEFLDCKVRTFSTGMRQRLGIALALLPHSEIVILDEPTNGLDPVGIVEIRRIIREWNSKFGTTVIVCSHLLGEMENICHKIALIDRGKLIASGNISDLLADDSRLVVNVPPESTGTAAEILLRASSEGRIPMQSVSGIDGTLTIRMENECAADVNRILVESGIRVSRLEFRKKTLEDFFLSNVGGAKC